MSTNLLSFSFAGALFSQAFSTIPTCGNKITIFDGATQFTTTALLAKKRRRRKSGSGGSKARSSSESSGPDQNEDSLPDFEIDDMETESESESSKKTAKANVNFNEITDAMMGSTSKPTRSIEDLINDRSLESKFEFDGEDEDVSIPDFTTIAKASGASGEPEGGKKKARQASRRAAAIQAREEAAENKIDIPFLQDEQGNISPIKVLETGAWVGIFLLVGWEFYLNSPFFERSAPMAPVIFE
eukprot:scaffold1120_cov127-Cylindrotheca_fusiformis.AAC.10